jgi:adenosylcobinamide kinase/adenosylcobinamide-phosphate guanylyltransferase
MRQRIARHQSERPAQWKTIEPPADPATVIGRLNGSADGLILDCLTMYVAQLLTAGASDARIEQRIRRLCQASRDAPCPVILVTNEVGCGVVPAFPLGRRFRDLAGIANQIAAACAEEVYLLVAGIPLLMKGRATACERPHAPRLPR